MSSTLRVGIIGCGEVAKKRHIPSFQKIKNVKIAALCDTNETVAKELAESLGISVYYPDISDMLKREKLDIVDICTSPFSHTPLSIKALEAGCHVLVEKPITLDIKEADDIIYASQSNNVKLCVVHNKLFQPMTIKAKKMVDNGLIGDLTGIDIRDGWVKNKLEFSNKDHWHHKLPGGVFGEILPHSIYLAMAFLGNIEPLAVHARKLCNYEWVIADELRVIMEGEKGLGTLTISFNLPKTESTIDIFGTNRNLHISLQSALLTKYGAGGGSSFWRAMDNISQSYQQLTCTASATFNTLVGRYYHGHSNLITKFIESIRNNTDPPVTGKEGREVVRLLDIIVARM